MKFDQICRGGEGPCPIANRLGSPQLELTNPTKEQLYDLFMRILLIKKYEHQILFNACQVCSFLVLSVCESVRLEVRGVGFLIYLWDS